MGEARKAARSDAEFWAELAPSEHIVQIYSDATILMDTLEGFVAGGIRAGDAVIVIATPEHRELLTQRLSALGIDPLAARFAGSFVALDAEETLAKFMVGGWPNDDRFHEAIDALLQRPRREGRRVRAFGEMVALLWARGNNGATVRLEYLWHKLVELEHFSLLCAYPKSGFSRGSAASLHGIFAAHSRALPG